MIQLTNFAFFIGRKHQSSGQLAAANVGNAFPEIWQDTMSVFQDKVPHYDFKTVKGIVSKELDLDKVFASFEEEPIGAASIGQGKVQACIPSPSFAASFLWKQATHKSVLFATWQNSS